MRRLMLVANPAASGFTPALHGDVVRILEDGYRVYAPWPDSREQAVAAARQAARVGYDVVVALGGDGTVNAVANGVVGTGTALGVVPAGTTNVLARIIGAGTRPRKAAEGLVEGRVRVRPLATLEVRTGDGVDARSTIATFAAGVGFDAEVIRASERRPVEKVGFGSLHYARSAVSAALPFRDRLPNLRVVSGADHADAVSLMVQAHDTFTYLGRRAIRLGPGSGPLALSVERLPTRRVLHMAALAALGRPIRGRSVRLWRAFDTLRVLAEPESYAEADGEVLGPVSRVAISPSAEGLLVVDPRPARSMR